MAVSIKPAIEITSELDLTTKMLHEFGHAVYDRYINPRLPYFLRTVSHTCTTEAIALMMGSLSEESGWLQGARENLRETVLRATGEPLSTAPFVGAIS